MLLEGLLYSDARRTGLKSSLSSVFPPQLRKQITSRMTWAIGEQHHQPVYADAFARGGRQAVFERADVVGVVVHGLGVAGFLGAGLFLEARGLVLGVVQFGKSVGDFPAGNVQLEAVGYRGIRLVAPRERRDLGRIIDDESRLEQQMLGGLLEQRELQPPMPSSGL